MEFFTIAFSTFLGAAVALAAERLSRCYDARLREEAAINNLILDLAAKRAFLVDDTWELLEGEMARVVVSVQHARTLVREARGSLRPRSTATPHLRRMARACNTFLEASERADDDALIAELIELTRLLASEVAALHALGPSRILADRPGSFALPPRPHDRDEGD